MTTPPDLERLEPERPDPGSSIDADAAHRAAAADIALAAWLTAARADLATCAPPAWLHSELQARLAEHEALAGVRATQPRRAAPTQRTTSAWRWVTWLALPVAAACALFVATAVVLQGPALDATPAAAPFIAIASMESIAAEPDKVVVPAELPRGALTLYGLPVDPSRADQPARAELLLSARGSVLALRFLQ
jgi:hypothetical protein